MNRAFMRVRGGLGAATVGANAVFAAVTGSSIASASVFTKIAVPEMLKLGYTPRFAVGVVAGSSVLGMIIPPSAMLIIYALVTEQSVGDMFLAGLFPASSSPLPISSRSCSWAIVTPNFMGGNAIEGVQHAEPPEVTRGNVVGCVWYRRADRGRAWAAFIPAS